MTQATKRPAGDEHWIEAARKAAKHSLCVRDQVGAAIVDASNRRVTTGYNGPPAGFDHEDEPCTTWCARSQSLPRPLAAVNPDGTVTALPFIDYTPCPGYTDCPSLHAEANALMLSESDARVGGTLYVTSHVCFPCAKLVANSGIARVVVAPSHDAAHRQSGHGYAFLDRCGVKVDIR